MLGSQEAHSTSMTRYLGAVMSTRSIEALTDDFVEHTPAPGQATAPPGPRTLSGDAAAFRTSTRDRYSDCEAERRHGGTMAGTHRRTSLAYRHRRRVAVQVMGHRAARDGRFCATGGLVDVPALMAQLGGGAASR